ncbi:MAG: Ig-like domain-containing protein [Lachnospiraceae bacterium]|nr:Ig-like domain-containing protein [Lachnospiraceae bacterium]
MKKNIKKRIYAAGFALLLTFISVSQDALPAIAAETSAVETGESGTLPPEETENSETIQPADSENEKTSQPAEQEDGKTSQPTDPENDKTSQPADSEDKDKESSLPTEPEESPMAITSIAPLSDEESEFFFDAKPTLEELNASFPKELSVFPDESGSPTPIPVTWECGDDYENTEFDAYEFTPVWDTDAYPLAPSFDAYTNMPSITVYVQQGMSSVRLLDAAKAQDDLASLIAGKDIYALLYLCDTYEAKQKPGKEEAASVNISTGQSVRITGVGEDSFHNIWYQTGIDIGGSSYIGYIERDYLAYADEDLLAWEDRWISGQTYRMDAETAQAKLPADIAQFPASYQSGLLNLKTAHPNWIFVRMETDLDWKTAVQEENKNSRSLISSSVTSSWKTADFDKSWSYPSDGILAYYMDPRNFLSENYIFQFELLSYNDTYHKESAVQSILNGTFMSGAIPGDSKGQSYAQAFCNIARQLGVSPFHLASRVRQEQGNGTSPLISGTHPSYPGVYNYFNIGATGKGSAQVIENGLKKAAEYKWTTRYLSLEGGSNIISKDYIRKGQNTLYLQKFNVSKTSPSGLYQHQYMQNIAAPSSEAVSVKKAYATAGSLNNPFVFRIPVYKNMPSSACPQPAAVKDITLNKTSLSLKAGESAVLTASIDGKPIDAPAAGSSLTFTSSNPKVASVAADGTVTAISAGTTDISCSLSGDSKAGGTASCTVTVAKTDPAYTLPALNAVTYAPNQTLANIKLPSGWTWDNPSIVPTVSNQGYPATFTPSDTGKYNTVKKNLSLTVNKGVPVYTVPSGLKASVGNTLSSIKLPAGFAWEKPETVLEKEGTVSYHASYNPDPANYQTAANIAVAVSITPKASSACTSHTYGEWTVTTPATCTAAGIQTRSCLSCNFKETREIPAPGHDYISTITKEATETAEGIRTYTCSKCQDSYTEAIAKLPASHKHSYSSSVSKQPSCIEKGIKTYTCSCGDTYSEEIPALGHDYTSKVTKDATETAEGVRTYTCSKCQDSYTEAIAKLPASHKHSYSSSVSKQPSCIEKGIKTYTCSCGDTYSEEIPALGHDMADSKCRRCGYQAPQANHNNGQTNGSSSSSGGSSSTSTSTSTNGSSPSGGNPPASGTIPSGSNPPASGTTPSGSNPPASGSSSNGGKKPADNTSDNSAAPTAPAQNVTIDMKNNTVLYEETISSIRGKDIDVILNMGNSISWTINGSNIVADEANGIDMGVTPDTGSIPDALIMRASALSTTGTVIGLSLVHNGPLDFHPVLAISTAPENAGLAANLYYYNPDSEQLEFMDAVEIDENGTICFTFSHASDYVIIISETVMTDTGVIVSDHSAGNEPSSESPSEDNGGGPLSEEEPSSLQPTTMVIIAVMLLIAIAIGITLFFILRSKKEADDDWEEDEDDEEDETDEIWKEAEDSSSGRKEFFTEDLSTAPDKKKFFTEDVSSLPNKGKRRKTIKEDSSLDDGDFDDYREPKKRKPVGNRPKIEPNEFDEDEFDGFE